MDDIMGVCDDFDERNQRRPRISRYRADAGGAGGSRSISLALRRFLAFSEQAAADLGLTVQWYQALLVTKTFRSGDHISVGELAEQLMIRDHSAAELVSRLVQAKLVKRKTDPSDRRRSLVIMTPSGNRRLAQLASVHLERLRENKDAFLNLFDVDPE